ncbi:TPA: hypothetical protein JBI01_08210 [Legionella pneumophila]|nr:hypothetical protein [Legionella pneumophila]HAU1225660.1 hypothetical protein [Legionella pneumophila]
MKHMVLFLSALNMIISSSFAGTGGVASSSPTNQTGFFVGLGGAYNRVQINSDTSGILNAISGFPPTGLFWGRTGEYSNTKQAFAPETRAGYFQPFKRSDWIWGLEFLYQYSRIKKTAYGGTMAPGTYINMINPNENVTNKLSISAIQTRVRDELMLPVFIGHTFSNSFIYLGAGPSLFRTQHTMYSGSDGLSGYYIGEFTGLANTKWVWGGAVQTGIAYYLNSSWFLKFNYSYARTGHYKINNFVAFSPEVNGGLNAGNVFFRSSYRLVAQEVALSINKVFAL